MYRFGADEHDRPNCSPFASCDAVNATKTIAQVYNVDGIAVRSPTAYLCVRWL